MKKLKPNKRVIKINKKHGYVVIGNKLVHLPKNKKLTERDMFKWIIKRFTKARKVRKALDKKAPTDIKPKTFSNRPLVSFSSSNEYEAEALKGLLARRKAQAENLAKEFEQEVRAKKEKLGNLLMLEDKRGEKPKSAETEDERIERERRAKREESDRSHVVALHRDLRDLQAQKNQSERELEIQLRAKDEYALQNKLAREQLADLEKQISTNREMSEKEKEQARKELIAYKNRVTGEQAEIQKRHDDAIRQKKEELEKLNERMARERERMIKDHAEQMDKLSREHQYKLDNEKRLADANEDWKKLLNVKKKDNTLKYTLSYLEEIAKTKYGFTRAKYTGGSSPSKEFMVEFLLKRDGNAIRNMYEKIYKHYNLQPPIELFKDEGAGAEEAVPKAEAPKAEAVPKAEAPKAEAVPKAVPKAEAAPKAEAEAAPKAEAEAAPKAEAAGRLSPEEWSRQLEMLANEISSGAVVPKVEAAGSLSPEEWSRQMEKIANEMSLRTERIKRMEEMFRLRKAEAVSPLIHGLSPLSPIRRQLNLNLLKKKAEAGAGNPDKPDEDPEKPVGSGQKYLRGGLYNDEIDDMMRRHNGYLGTITRDELFKLLPMIKHYWKGNKPYGFIMNTLTQDSRLAIGHWVAICFIPKKSINYYDSFGEPAPKELKRDLKEILDKINKKNDLIKFKENLVREQSVNTANCGWYCMRFLERMFMGETFVESTPYSNVMKSERLIQKYIDKFKKFKYFKAK